MNTEESNRRKHSQEVIENAKNDPELIALKTSELPVGYPEKMNEELIRESEQRDNQVLTENMKSFTSYVKEYPLGQHSDISDDEEELSNTETSSFVNGSAHVDESSKSDDCCSYNAAAETVTAADGDSEDEEINVEDYDDEDADGDDEDEGEDSHHHYDESVNSGFNFQHQHQLLDLTNKAAKNNLNHHHQDEHFKEEAETDLNDSNSSNEGNHRKGRVSNPPDDLANRNLNQILNDNAKKTLEHNLNQISSKHSAFSRPYSEIKVERADNNKRDTAFHLNNLISSDSSKNIANDPRTTMASYWLEMSKMYNTNLNFPPFYPFGLGTPTAGFPIDPRTEMLHRQLLDNQLMYYKSLNMPQHPGIAAYGGMPPSAYMQHPAYPAGSDLRKPTVVDSKLLNRDVLNKASEQSHSISQLLNSKRNNRSDGVVNNRKRSSPTDEYNVKSDTHQTLDLSKSGHHKQQLKKSKNIHHLNHHHNHISSHNRTNNIYTPPPKNTISSSTPSSLLVGKPMNTSSPKPVNSSPSSSSISSSTSSSSSSSSPICSPEAKQLLPQQKHQSQLLSRQHPLLFQHHHHAAVIGAAVNGGTAVAGNYLRYNSGGRRPRDPTKPPAVRKYKCDLCTQAFSRSNTLVTHRRIHTGEKPFSCEICGRAFRQPGNLTRHRMTHTTLKPHVCHICNKAFNRASNLQTHIQTHVNNSGGAGGSLGLCGAPLYCPYCGLGFSDKKELKVHVYIHGAQCGGQSITGAVL